MYTLYVIPPQAEARLGRVRGPSLVIVGTEDTDWAEPEAEAKWIASQLGSERLLLDRAGHHPHVECPKEVAEAVADFAGHLREPRMKRSSDSQSQVAWPRLVA
jgi:pimeloyl-ACP methyl ester carboxylesterase